MGLFISGIPIVVITASLLCLVEGFILLPCRLQLIGPSVVKKCLKNKKNNKHTDWFTGIQNCFTKLCHLAVKYRYITCVIFVFVLFLSFVMLVKNQFILFPA